MLEESLTTFFPSWLVRLDTPPASRDPLGLQAHAMRQADGLLPGLNVFTSRARYYSFLCWALQLAQRAAPRPAHLDRALRLERLLVLCEAILHADDPFACSYVGRRRGRRFVAERAGTGLWELPTKILKNQVSNGALRLYRTSLANLGLIEEDDLEEGLGLRLTDRGQKLANQYEKTVDDNMAAWALDPATTQRKRRDSISNAARGMCLSARPGAYERRYLVDALVGKDGSAIERRETVTTLFEHDLLEHRDVGEDVAGADPDVAITGEQPAEQAEEHETQGNWRVIKGALGLSPSRRLHAIQVAAAYQLAALGQNALLRAALDPVIEHGRVPIKAWLDKVGERAGDGFTTSSAIAWAGHRPAIDVAEDLLDANDRPWQEIATLAIELLLRLGLDERYIRLLGDDPSPSVDLTIAWARDAATERPREMVGRLLPELVERHREVSARKGKGEWVVLDDHDLVKSDPRSLTLMLHSLRFTQLAQLAADLSLSPEDVADEP